MSSQRYSFIGHGAPHLKCKCFSIVAGTIDSIFDQKAFCQKVKRYIVDILKANLTTMHNAMPLFQDHDRT
jgi:hypothetical protein